MTLDVVFPAHNEERRIDRTLTRYRNAVADRDARFLVALDGCVDGTLSVVRRHRAADPRVEVLDLPKLGKGGALAEGLRRGRATVLAFVDADGATPPAELLRLVDRVALGGTDVAIASRRLPASVTPSGRSWSRRATSFGFAAGIRRLFDLQASDTQCGAKAISARAAGHLVPLLSSRDFLFDVDLLVTSRRLGLRVEEIPTVWVDKDGSKVDALRDARRMAASAMRLWVHHRVLPVEQLPEPSSDEAVIDLVGHRRTHAPVADTDLVGA